MQTRTPSRLVLRFLEAQKARDVYGRRGGVGINYEYQGFWIREIWYGLGYRCTDVEGRGG